MLLRPWIVAGLAVLSATGATIARSEESRPTAAISFDRDVQPVLRKRCAGCHNPERPRGELDLTSYAGALAGGAGGRAVVARAPDDSPVYMFAAHLEEPHMPPNAPRIPQREVDVLRRWIEGGLAEKAGDAAVKPAGGARGVSPPGPSGGLAQPVAPPRATAITALAVSPTRPVAAVSGHRQVLVYDLAAGRILGALAFPEGDVFSLRFSSDGASLLAGGGLGAESGKVVLFDAKGWGRIATLGDETDAILGADLSPDGSRIVLGGPSRVVKVLSSPGGESIHAFRKPTDWVTAASFGPDGLLVAAGDRFGGLFLWEARSGKEFLTLRGHARAITAIGWLADRDALVTAGEDGVIRVWDLHTGKADREWSAHPAGVLGIDIDRWGRIASAGRDRRLKVWDARGRLVADLGPAADQATRVGWTPDGRSLVSGDCAGKLRVWSLDTSSYRLLPMLVAPRTTPLAMVVPDVAPARPYVRGPAPAPPAGDRQPAVDDLATALASARAAAAAAEKAVADLSRLARARARSKDGTQDRDRASRDHRLEALDAARAGLASLRAALAADPDNAPLTRAVEEAERAVQLLEGRRDGPRPAAVRP